MTAITIIAGGPQAHVTVYQYNQLTGGNITDAGTGYAVDDTITLASVGGVTFEQAQLTVAMVDMSGAVQAFSISMGGIFPTNPTSFAQGVTSGSGTGFTLGSPTYAPIQQFPYQIAWSVDAVLQPVTITPDATGFFFQAPVGMLPTSVPADAVATNTSSGGVGTLQVMVVDGAMTFSSP